MHGVVSRRRYSHRMGTTAWIVIAGIVAIATIIAYVVRHRDRWPQAIFVGLGVFVLLFAVKWGIDEITSFVWIPAEG